MKYLTILLCVSLLACGKEDPVDNNNNNNGNGSSLFSCKVNGVLYEPDSAYFSVKVIFGDTIIDIQSFITASGGYLEEGVAMSLSNPTYKGVGSYDVPVDSLTIVDLDIILAYVWGRSISDVDTYSNGLCDGDPSLGSKGNISITDYQTTTISGTFYGSTCLRDSVVTITEGVFNDVQIFQ